MQATAVEEDGEFIVLEGSEALTDTGYSKQNNIGLKEKLIKDGVLETQGAQRLKFTKPWSFRSPTAAAETVLDRNSNGRIEWKVKGSRQSYHDWQQAQAGVQEEAAE